MQKKKVDYIYHQSQIHKLAKGFWEKLKISFRYSFLGRITEEKQTTSGILDNSRGVQYVFNLYKKGGNKVTRCLRTSSAIILTKKTKKDLYFSPVKITSVILITAIIINVVFSFVLQNKIGIYGWLMRGLLLFLAVSGLFCKAGWPTVKSSSIFLRKMWMH